MASKYLKETVQSYENYIEKNGIDESVINAFKEQEDNNIYIVPINSNLDAVFNFPMGTTVINSRNSNTIQNCTDDTHPSNSGYYQISDSYYCFLKCN